MRLPTNIFRLASVGLFLIAIAGCGFAQPNRTPTTLDNSVRSETIAQLPSAPAPNLQAESKGGLGQGIQVHGWWAISVLNPDGTQVQHTEFENDLVPLANGGGGDVFLARVLGAQGSIQGWSIVLFPMPGLTLASCPSRVCSSSDNGSLKVTVSGGQLVLEGTKVAPSDMAFSVVSSWAHYCLSPVMPSVTASAVTDGSCTPALYTSGEFTSAWINPSTKAPISVTAGQQVHIIVTFSFS
jgi:hypothetical protein